MRDGASLAITGTTTNDRSAYDLGPLRSSSSLSSAAVLGFSGIAGTAVNIAWILAVVGIVLALIFVVLGRRPPV